MGSVAFVHLLSVSVFGVLLFPLSLSHSVLSPWTVNEGTVDSSALNMMIILQFLSLASIIIVGFKPINPLAYEISLGDPTETSPIHINPTPHLWSQKMKLPSAQVRARN